MQIRTTSRDLLPLQPNDQLCLPLVRRDAHMVPVKLWGRPLGVLVSAGDAWRVTGYRVE